MCAYLMSLQQKRSKSTQINAKRNIEAERISKLEEVKQLEIARDQNENPETGITKNVDNSMIEANREVDEMQVPQPSLLSDLRLSKTEVEIVDKNV